MAGRARLGQPHARGIKALLEDIAEDPKGPHLVLVDSLGIGPKARERMQLAGCRSSG